MICDVAVIGGGRAGSAAARMLAAAGCEVLLVDRPGRRRFGESLIPAARTLLADLGVREAFDRDGHLPCHGNESIWGSARATATDFINSPHGHAWHLDGTRLDRRLRAAARSAGTTVWRQTSLVDARRQASSRAGSRPGWRLSLARTDGELRDVGAHFVVDATGRRRVIARRLGVPRRWDDRLIAFEALFRAAPGGAESDHDTVNLVEAVAEGWWYTARRPARREEERVAVFFTDAGTPWFHSARTPAGFLQLLDSAPAVREKLVRHRYELADGPRPTDARSSRLERLGGKDWLAIGDAAMAFDPLSSQGIFTALYAGVQSSRAILAHLDGAPDALTELEADLGGVYDRFRANRPQFYQLERRWPGSAFWRPRLREKETSPRRPGKPRG